MCAILNVLPETGGTITAREYAPSLRVQPGLMDQERDYLDALDEAKDYKVVSGKLHITAEGTLLVLKPA